MKWSDITLAKYYEIQDILSVEDDYTVLNLIDCLYNVDSQSLPVYKLKEFDISFLKTPIPEVSLKKKYTINGTVYKSNCDLTRVSVAQFIDYQNYSKESPRFENILSIFFLPEGATEYNTGYDINKVKEDLLQLPIDTVRTIAFFFERQLRIFFWLFQRYLLKQVKKLKMEKQQKKELIQNLKQVDFWSLASFPIFLNTVKSRMKQSHQ